MSAAATAAGYLYASGRLRGRQSKEHEHAHAEKQPREAGRPREEVRVAAMPAEQDTRPRRQPTIQYRTRRWRPDESGKPE
jgi:hypothetical protein